MKLVVLGATGGVGREIVRQAVEDGHAVTAFVRSPERLKAFRDHITIVQGDLLDSVELEKVLVGQDAVLSGFGPRQPLAKGDVHLLERFASVLTGAMRKAHVRRVVVVSTAFLFKDAILPPAYLFGRLLFPSVVADATAMERIFEKSGLDWTMVRPPALTDKAYTGRYHIREAHLPRLGFAISRADVADAMIKTVINPATVGKVIGVAN